MYYAPKHFIRQLSRNDYRIDTVLLEALTQFVDSANCIETLRAVGLYVANDLRVRFTGRSEPGNNLVGARVRADDKHPPTADRF
jgi:hypothetical protein